MRFVTEIGGKKLSVSPWRDAGKVGVFVSLAKGGECQGMLLTCAVAEHLIEAVEAILDDIQEPAD